MEGRLVDRRWLEAFLRSRTARGLLRVQVGFSLIRSWSADVQVPRGSVVHLFDILLYRMSNQEKSFAEWLRER
jgi:hypothetical protein